MADDIAPSVDPFDQEVASLVQILMENGARPAEAVAVAGEVARQGPGYRKVPGGPLEVDIAPGRLPRPQRAQVGEGQYGLPSIPPVAQNALAGPQDDMEPVRSPVPSWLTDQVAQVRDEPLPNARFPSGLFEPIADTARFGAELTGVPSMVRGSQRISDSIGTEDPYNINKLAGAAEIAAGVIPGAAAARATAPAVGALFKTVPRVGATGAVLGAPAFADAAMSDTPADARANEIKRLEGEIAQHQKDIGAIGIKIGQTRFRGNDAEAGAARKAAIEEASKPYNSSITEAQKRIAKLQGDADREAQEKETRGAPVREMLPPILSKTLPITTGIIGGMATRGIFNKYNKEYNNAVTAYRDAERTGNAAEMSMRAKQLSNLESNTPWSKPQTYLAAGLPLELRAAEHGIDMRSDADSRAYKEANATMHDPYAIGREVGTGLLSAGTALGLGAKFSKDQPERALGKAISSGTAYDDAPALARQYETALQAGRDVQVRNGLAPAAQTPAPGLWQRLTGARTQAPPASGAPPQEPIALTARDVPNQPAMEGSASRNALAGPSEKLADRLPQYRQAAPEPTREALPSPRAQQSTSDRPWWAGDPPDYIRLKPGEHWDIKMQRVRREDGTTSKTRYIPPGTKNQ